MLCTASEDKPNYQKVFLIQLVIFVVLQGLDLITTLYGLKHKAIEANTFIVGLGTYISIPSAVILSKTILSLMFCWFYWELIQNEKHQYRYALLVMD